MEISNGDFGVTVNFKGNKTAIETVRKIFHLAIHKVDNVEKLNNDLDSEAIWIL